MGKDYIKSISKDIDNFIQCKYDLQRIVVIGELKVTVPIGDKKHRIQKWYCYVFTLLVTLLTAYYTKTMPTLTKATIVSSLLTTAHSVFGHVTTADKIKSTTQ
ncbi:PRA1 family protein [Entamoeba marina]